MKSMIVAPQPQAVEEGAKTLMNGGNAIDAAVTCAFVQMIVDFHCCGIGGYILLTIHPTSSFCKSNVNSTILDAPALAGSKGDSAMWEDKIIRPNPDGWGYFLEGKVNECGYQSICTPGTVKGLANILQKWGTISWEEAIAPAAHIAQEGFIVDSTLANSWKSKAKFPESSTMLDYIKKNQEASRIYLKSNGSPYDAGERLHNPDYARTLLHLAKEGADDFYLGELANNILNDLEANNSFITTKDFQDYKIREDGALFGSYHEFTLNTVPPPHGGPTLLAILNILEGYDLSSYEHNSANYIYLVSMAMKAAFADRNKYLADMAFIDVPLEWMVSKERANEWRKHIDSDQPIDVSFTPFESPDTTHVTVVDNNRNCVALTHSLGMSSGVITPGLGFMYNNSMINYHPIADHPNSYSPGKSRTTGMAPTIIYKNDQPILILGAPGAPRIITSILQVILNVIDFRMSISDAVHAPRFDCEGNLIQCQARIPEMVCVEIRKKHPVVRTPFSHGGLGLVHAITIDPVNGKLAGAADTGSDGMAIEV